MCYTPNKEVDRQFWYADGSQSLNGFVGFVWYLNRKMLLEYYHLEDKVKNLGAGIVTHYSRGSVLCSITLVEVRAIW